MEIKKGISQMAEYPNVEINYVVPMDGQMYYVLRDGVLANGAVIATLDPKRAIDAKIATDTIGVFAEDGSVLIDFDKKDIRKIDDDFLVVVNSIPKSAEVVNALKNEDDEISKTMMKDSASSIVDKLLIEMGIAGEMLFSDPYSEANIYKTDGVNKAIGIEASFIGKNDDNFYFHTNDASSSTTVIGIQEEETTEMGGFEMPTDFSTIPSVEAVEEQPTEVPAADSVEDNSLDINQSIFGNFKPVEDEISNIEVNPEEEVTPVATEEETNSFISPVTNELPDNNDMIIPNSDYQIEEETTKEVEETPEFENSSDNNDAVLDNVIAVMKKMIEETSKLNSRITELENEIAAKEEEIAEKNEVISREESKKNTLSGLLDEANEVLENIE